MAQVYSFVDDNGITRLLAEISPDVLPAAGGTLTGALAVNPTDPLDDPIIGVQAPAGAENHGTYLIQLVSDIAARFYVDTDAGLTLLNASGPGFAQATVADGSGYVQLVSPGVGAPDAILVYVGGATFRVLTTGSPIIAQHAAPADGSLAAGECSLWFDQSDGAAKLMVKAKTANGTVATAAIALS